MIPLPDAVKHWIKDLFGAAGYAVINTRWHYGHDGLYTLHNDRFRRDPAFRAAYERGLKSSNGVDSDNEWRIHVALWTAANALRVPGDFVECGVNTGFVSSAIMQYLDWRAVEKRFYLVDTFSGPVLGQYSAEEMACGRVTIAEGAIAAGAYATDVERVRANFAEWPNAVVVKGAVPEVLPSLGGERVAYLHIDMNCAHPERAALEYFWERLSPGGFVLFDDYAYTGADCQADAIDAAARELGARVLALPTGQGLIVR
ncbi:MAG TPA: TylF/MycF/NovP-related O-methyltransferase [Bryobacteraceae bacterium]|nr:TylF/MycF/NovP-related O-methyltransferase [Bryobacteraceae bacterium]